MTRGVLSTLQGELGEAVADLELSTPMAHEHGEVLACALGHAYLCLALTFAGLSCPGGEQHLLNQ